ncbi:ROK family transcriptional regulator [Nonomuraea sp. NPDC050790]|uniref:ROK family transcriptional regulator n=1 Tax=Nonomuraea sp. NPDC050790 TaxID=3364371 RepID=UPI0037B0FA7B
MPRTASPHTARLINDRAAFDLLLEHGSLSRAELQQRTGLSRATIGDLVDRLEAADLITPVGESPARRRGPNAVLYGVVAAHAHVAGVEVRAGEVLASVNDLTGSQVGSARRPLDPAAEPDQLVFDTITAALQDAQLSLDRLDGVVVGTPGLIDPETGDVSFVGALPTWHANLLPGLRARLGGLPVLVENEVNLIGLAEHRLGAARGEHTFALLSLGTGVGMAVILNGRLHRGRSGGAGEIAYLPLGLTGGTFPDLMTGPALHSLPQTQNPTPPTPLPPSPAPLATSPTPSVTTSATPAPKGTGQAGDLSGGLAGQGADLSGGQAGAGPDGADTPGRQAGGGADMPGRQGGGDQGGMGGDDVSGGLAGRVADLSGGQAGGDEAGRGGGGQAGLGGGDETGRGGGGQAGQAGGERVGWLGGVAGGGLVVGRMGVEELGALVRRASPVFLDALADRIVFAARAVCAVLDPGVLILAGVIGRAGGEALAVRVEERLARSIPLPTRVMPGTVEGDPVLRGAVVVALERLYAQLFDQQ